MRPRRCRRPSTRPSRARPSATAKIIPGAAPDLGVLPDKTVINLITGDEGQGRRRHPGPRQPGRWPTRTSRSASDVNKDVHLSARGYQFKGEPSAQEQALATRLLAGDTSVANMLANMRLSRLEAKPRDNPVLDKAMRSLAIAMVATGMGAALGPGIGALLGPAAASAGAAPEPSAPRPAAPRRPAAWRARRAARA